MALQVDALSLSNLNSEAARCNGKVDEMVGRGQRKDGNGSIFMD